MYGQSVIYIHKSNKILTANQLSSLLHYVHLLGSRYIGFFSYMLLYLINTLQPTLVTIHKAPCLVIRTRALQTPPIGIRG
ncbi:hypothetical protein FKM82_012310 [Ascaphus truei]